MEKLLSMIYIGKVENIWKGSLDWIPSISPSVKIQIMGGKVCLRCKGKSLLTMSSKQKICWHHLAMFCLITSSKLSCQKFEFSLKMKVMGSNPGYLLKIFSTLPTSWKVNSPAHNLNFHWSWRLWDQIQAIFLTGRPGARNLWPHYVKWKFLTFCGLTGSNTNP